MTMIEIYNSAGTLQCSFPRVLSASLCDKLSGERTLSFSVLASRSQLLRVGMTAKLDGQFYNIVRVSKKITGGFPVTTAQCEHITYLLNEEQYNLVTFVFEGTPADGMTRLLSGTPFSVGVIEATGRVECAFTDQSPLSRRSALMRFIDACGCEVEYDGYKINLRKHRGSTVRKSLMDGENVTDLAVTVDSRENTQSYEISLFKMADLQAGDEVNITYTPMGVNVDTRIISIEYDPFYRYTVRVEVGDYVPNLLASTATQLDRVRQEFKAADGKLLSTIETIGGNLSSVSQTASKINWLVKSGTSESDFAMTDRAVKLVSDRIDLSGYVTVSALGTAGKTTINGANITTGKISADRIDVSTLKFNKLYAGSSFNVAITSSGTETLYIGGDGTWNYDYLNVFADTIQFKQFDAGTTSMLVMDIGSRCLRPNADRFWNLGNVLYGFGTLYIEDVLCRNGTGNCGSDTYPFSEGFIKKLYLGKNCYLTADGASLCVNGVAIGGESKISKLYAGTTTYYAELNSSYAFVPSTVTYDFTLGSSSYPWKKAYITKLYLNGTEFTPQTVDTSKISYSSLIYASLNASKQFIPSGTGYYLGSSTYPWQYAYITNLYLNGTKFDPTSIGTDMSGKEVKMGGSSYYYVTATKSRELRPNSSSTANPFYLGTLTDYWHYAYIGSNTVKLGSTVNSRIGFFVGTPIVRQTLSSTSQNMGYSTATASNYLKILNNLVGILVKYGLIGT